MKNKRYILGSLGIALLLLSAFTLVGCGGGSGGGKTPGGGNPATVSGVLMVGSYTGSAGWDYIPCYWTDTLADAQRLQLSEVGGTYGEACAVGVCGGTVYIGGGTYTDSDTYNKPCYWTKSQGGNYVCKTPAIPDNAHPYGQITAIAVSGETVYMAGYYADKDKKRTPCYWAGPDNKPVTLPTPLGSNGGCASAIAVDGTTIYTAGCYYNVDKYSFPYAWQGNSEITPEPAKADGASSGGISGIAISGGKVYFSGSCYFSENKVDKPYYWTTGSSTANPLTTVSAKGGAVRTMFDNGGTPCLAGNDGDSPCVWAGLTASPGVLSLSNATNSVFGYVNCSAVGGGTVYMAGYYGKLSNPSDPNSVYILYPCWWAGTNSTQANLLNIPAESARGGWVNGILVQ